MGDAVTVGGSEDVPEEPQERLPEAAAGESPPQEPDVDEPVLGGPKDDPQEAIATHSGMWWPPTVDAETSESSEDPASEAGDAPPQP
jgi:hypothetical protein